MTDVVDDAQEREERERETAIQRALMDAADSQRPSARVDCEDCGARIPAARLEIVPGARCCVGCQTLRDREAVPSR
jgi:phage/conjugal plasmid C-4 type zinc finger TraR family protein